MSARPTAQIANFGPSGVSSQLVASGVQLIAGWSFAESTGTAAASVIIWDSTSGASGTHYGVITLAPGESTRDWFGGLALACLTGGLYLQVAAGQVRGAVFYQ